MKTGLIIIILIVVILLFMAAGWYVMNKIDGFMNRTRRTNDKDTMTVSYTHLTLPTNSLV